MKHYFEWVWVILGNWWIILREREWVGVYGELFWVGGWGLSEGGLGIILGEWRWVGMSVGGWGWKGVGALFDNAHNK